MPNKKTIKESKITKTKESGKHFEAKTTQPCVNFLKIIIKNPLVNSKSS